MTDQQDQQALADEVQLDSPEPEDEGPGCLPGILAAGLIAGMLCFISCGGCTWWLYQQRTGLAVRTLDQTYIPYIEQSYLQPEEKGAVVDQLKELSKDMKRGKYENWQSSGVMQRIVRLPVAQWGELNVIEEFLLGNPNANSDESIKQLSRLRRAVELGKVTAVDVDAVLQSVLVDDQSPMQRSIAEALESAPVESVIQEAKIVADRAGVPDKVFRDVRIEKILQREIEAGITDGSY